MSEDQERAEYMVRYRVWIPNKIGGYYHRGLEPNFGLYKTVEGAMQNTAYHGEKRELHRFVVKREEVNDE